MTREEAIRTLNFGAWWDNLNPEMSDADSEPLFEALDMAISALKQQQEQESKPLNGWISVKDRLPETDGNYIVCDRRINGKQWIHEAGFRKASSSWYELHGLYYDGFGRYGEQDKFTHWMPMPKPPKGE